MKPIVGLDIETLSRPKEAAHAGKIPIMTTWAFSAQMPGKEYPILLAGLMPVRQLIQDGNHICPDTLNWWLTDETNEAVRAAQIKHWNRQKHSAFLMVYNEDFGEYEIVDSATTRGQLFGLFMNFRDMVGSGAHFMGNGCEFDMSVFDLYFDHPIYKFWEVGSARTLKWMSRQKDESMFTAMQVQSELKTEKLMKALPKDFVDEWGYISSKHDAVFDVVSETILSQDVLSDFIK